MKLTYTGMILLLSEVFQGMAYHQDDYTVVYERTEVARTDERYMKIKTHTFKYNRTQAVSNGTIEAKIDFGNRLKVVVQGYKFTSNEYRLFPIVFDRNVCNLIEKDEFGMKNLYKCGNMFRCPVKKGNYTVCNWFPDGPKMPPYIPSGRYMLELKYHFFSTEIAVLQVYAAVKRMFD